MFVGGGLMAAVVFAIFYFPVRKATAAYQARRREKIAAGRARWRKPAAVKSPSIKSPSIPGAEQSRP